MKNKSFHLQNRFSYTPLPTSYNNNNNNNNNTTTTNNNNNNDNGNNDNDNNIDIDNNNTINNNNDNNNNNNNNNIVLLWWLDRPWTYIHLFILKINSFSPGYFSGHGENNLSLESSTPPTKTQMVGPSTQPNNCDSLAVWSDIAFLRRTNHVTQEQA